MNQCAEIRTQVAFYFDGELQGAERSALEVHLGECASCREVFDAERSFLETIRGLEPVHNASQSLRDRVATMLAEAPAPHSATPQLRRRVQRSLWQRPASAWLEGRHRLASLGVLAAAVMALGIWAAVEFYRSRPNPPSEFALLAVDTHQRYIRGQLPLEIASGRPDQISAWFQDKVPFSVELPTFGESSGQEKLYALDGARLVGHGNDYAAYIAYKTRSRPISLLVTSADSAPAEGGEEIVSNGLTFHFDSIRGLKVITWSHRGLTYALVSDLEERGEQSCVVCHQGARDQDFIDKLKR